MSDPDRLRRLDRRFAQPMCYVSLASLLALAVLLHFHEREEYLTACLFSAGISAALWPCYLLELFCSWRAGSPRTRERLWCCVLPLWRLAARDHETGRRIWLPRLGWKTVSEELRARLERAGNVPMIVIACLVLPLIAVEFHYAELIEANPRLAASAAAATALIWFAFTLEFVVMCSLAEKKVKYCREHWLDLAIILLPLVAFLRALRLGRLLRLQQLTRTARIYRMRGLLTRVWRALLVLEIVRRILHGRPEQRLNRLEELILLKEQELEQLRAEQQGLRARLAPQQFEVGDESRRAA